MKLDPKLSATCRASARELHAFPFQIIQSQKDIAFAYEYASSNRVVNMGKFKEAPWTLDGTSNGHWEGNTLVVDVSGLNGESWFDRSGNSKPTAPTLWNASRWPTPIHRLRSDHRGQNNIYAAVEDQHGILPA